MDRRRQRHRHQAGVLASEEQAHEVGVGFRHQRHARLPRQVQCGEAARQIERIATQAGVSQGQCQLAARVVEVAAGGALRGVVEGLGEGLEIGEPQRQRVARGCRVRHIEQQAGGGAREIGAGHCHAPRRWTINAACVAASRARSSPKSGALGQAGSANVCPANWRGVA